MSTLIELYLPTILIFGAIGGLLLVQLLVADVAGILKKHVPGTQVSGDHSQFLFRAVRAHGNTNESVAKFILLALFAMFTLSPNNWVNTAATAYLIGRIGHMCCYYADLRILRSVFFVVSLLGLVGLAVAGMLGLGIRSDG